MWALMSMRHLSADVEAAGQLLGSGVQGRHASRDEVSVLTHPSVSGLGAVKGRPWERGRGRRTEAPWFC